MTAITDLHCHILPGIDDGAKDLSVTRALLEEEKRQGVTQIAFTPHFYADQKSLKQFLNDRYQAAVSADPVLSELGIAWNAGGEVRLVPQLLEMDLSPLRYVDTKYLLLEWPFTQYPIWGDEVVYNLLDQGIRPIFAHIERYEYFWFHPDVLKEYIDDGVIIQINAGAVLHSNTKKQAIHLIKKGLVHIMASDTHNMETRPPRLKHAFEVVEKEAGRRHRERMLKNADDIFHGRMI